MDEELSLTLTPRPCAPCFVPAMDEELSATDDAPMPCTFCRVSDEELTPTLSARPMCRPYMVPAS
jgi:hypothetical protein